MMTELSYNADNILSNFPQCLRKNIEELCLRGKTGLSSVTLKDISIPNMRLVDDDDVLNNFHFIMKVPFAGKRLKWEIIFDPEDFHFTPDFDFNDDQFLEYTDYDTIAKNIENLENWDLNNPQALSLVLKQFLALYKKQQLEKLQMENIYSHYWEEYETLTKENGIKPEHIEVGIEGNNIVFLIALAVDCSSLPEYMQPELFRGSKHGSWYNPGEDYAHLKITFLKLDSSHPNISLELSPRIDQIFGKKSLTLPDFKKDFSIYEYVLSVSTLLQNRVSAIANHYRMKKVYVTSIAATFCRNIVEYDSETFTKAVFIYDVDDYDCLVTITLGAKFPLEKPSVLLSSLYCQEGKMCIEKVDKYPYNSTLRPEANIEHLSEYLYDAVRQFKCHRH